MRRPPLALLAVAVALAGCPAPPTKPPTGGPNTTPATRKPASPAPTGAAGPATPGVAAALAGAVRVLVPRSALGGQILSDNGAGVVSNNTGSLVANNGGGVVTNNGGNVISDNGGGLAGKAKYAVAQAAGAPLALAVADARVVACDAAGTPLKGPDGAEIVALTDAQGRYRFAALPAQGVVLQVQLAAQGMLTGGQLQAIAPRDRAAGGEVAIDTTSSLGAAYVLGKYVQGQQATLDRLPATAADRLGAELRTAAGDLAEAPAYRADALTGLVEGLRGRAAALDQALEAIRALLVGQVGGGDGRQAAAVAIAGPRGFARLPDGRLAIGERSFGRIRTVAADGTVGTYADLLRGELKTNFPEMSDLCGAPDGTLYVTSGFRVWKIDPQKQATIFAGGETGVPGPVDVQATATTLAPSALALGPDGTLYVGEARFRGGETGPARVLAIAPDGVVRQVPYDPADTRPGRISGLTVAPDGTLYVLRYSPDRHGTLVAYKAGQPPRVVLDKVPMADIYGGVAVTAGGTLYVGLFDQLLRIEPDGARTVLAGRDGPPALRATIRVTDSLLLEPDGTLLIGDAYYNVVHALRPDGTATIRAGTTSAVAGGGALSDVALAAPGGVAFGPDGRLVIAPRDGRELVVFQGGAITAWLGLDAPADVGPVGYPSGLAYRGGDLFVLDEGNHRLLKVAADGKVTKLVGYGGVGPRGLARGQRRPAESFPAIGDALVLDGKGRPYWVDVQVRQVYRLADDGLVELVAGQPFEPKPGQSNEATIAEILATEIGDGGPADAATLVQPCGLAFDLNGDLLVTDAALGVVRRISGLDGPRPTIDGLYGRPAGEFVAMGGDPAAHDLEADPAKTPFYTPFAIVVAPNGDRYVSELGTVALGLLSTTAQTIPQELKDLLPVRYARVRRITPDGKMSVVAGPGSKYFTDPLGPDALITPMALALGADGRLAICDNAANLVRILAPGTF